MKILITGAGGQLARALTDLIVKRNQDTAVGLTREQLDIVDDSQVRSAIETFHPDVVINGAAYNFVDQAELEPEPAYAVNQKGPANLALETQRAGIPLIHVSTDYVFDGTWPRPYKESDRPNPLSVYGKSKLAGELAVLQSNSKAFVVRTAWVYSVGARNFPTTILSLKDKPVLTIVDDLFGCPTYAPHLAQGILDLLQRRAQPGVYHMAGAGSASWFSFAQRLFEDLKIATPIKPISAKDYSYRAPRPKYAVLATEHAEFRLPAWEQGVADFVKNYGM